MYSYEIFRDEYPQNPREETDSPATMVCWHKRYELGDEQPEDSPESWLASLWAEYGNEKEKHSMLTHWLQHAPYDVIADYLHSTCGVEELIVEAELMHPGYKFPEALIALPLYLYDHSGITMNTTGFSCGWDSGQVGWIYVVEEDAKKYWGDITRDQIKLNLKAEVEEYDNYLTGNIYGYRIFKGDPKEEHDIESCWGICGYVEAENMAKEAIQAWQIEQSVPHRN